MASQRHQGTDRYLDSLLAQYTEFLRDGKPGIGGTFKKAERQAVETTFTAHANSDNCWDCQSLKSYLITRLPQDGIPETLLNDCTSSLWTLMTYFAHWPFNTLPKPNPSSIDFSSFFRAMVFLSGAHQNMFWPVRIPEDEPERNDSLPFEYVFRALSTGHLEEQEVNQESEEQPHILSRQPRDILAVLYSVQPVRDSFTEQLGPKELIPTVISLSPPPAPELQTLTIPTATLTSLLSLLILEFERAKEIDTSTWCLELKELYEGVRADLQQLETVSFDVFSDKLGGFQTQNFYYGISHLFRVFPFQ
ncbi:unnamed protein product [Clonostachys rosea]|uniref:Uncharacterized protein n=1 Tax=Bionectria ochroleuca TaxID=29856 RepID=A0ABY6UMS9_BIOOC|nr:unnamed protein product [Clonostachys rosea]